VAFLALDDEHAIAVDGEVGGLAVVSSEPWEKSFWIAETVAPRPRWDGFSPPNVLLGGPPAESVM
jgi:hypothetical protein